jgi:4'-phosphopantetheinyl transferase
VISAPDRSSDGATDDVRVWACSTERPAGDAERCKALLPDHEVARTARFRSPTARAQALVAAALLHGVLADETRSDPRALRFRTECGLCGHPTHGKPALAPGSGSGPLSFNLAHTAGLAVLAVATTEVGVDVERQAAWDVAGARRLALSPEEQQRVANLPPGAQAAAFLRLWTLKEAYLKGIGLGIVHEPAGVTFALNDSGWSTVVDGGRTTSWSARSLDLGESWCAALAVDGSPRRVRCLEWSP